MVHAKVRTDNLTGTVFGGDLVSVKYQPSGKDTEIDNGNFVKVGALISGEREVHTVALPPQIPLCPTSFSSLLPRLIRLFPATLLASSRTRLVTFFVAISLSEAISLLPQRLLMLLPL